MKLHFDSNQDYQLEAIQSIVGVFEVVDKTETAPGLLPRRLRRSPSEQTGPPAADNPGAAKMLTTGQSDSGKESRGRGNTGLR
jgi:hypothetical protein